MVNEPMSPLDPRLLDALRADRPAPADARGRVRARLEAIVPEMRQTPRGGSGSGSAGALGSRTTAIAAFLIGGATGAALLSALTGARPARVVYVDRVAPSVTVAAASVTAPPNNEGSAVSPLLDGEMTGSDTMASRSRPTQGAPASRASRLAAERRLLDEARSALLAGEPARAVERLDRHRVHFPDGLLVEERDAMRVEALVKASRYDEARSLGSAFRARWPASLFLATVDSAIASIP